MAAQHTTYTTYIFLQGKMSVFLSVNAIRLLGHSVNAGNCMKTRHYAMYVMYVMYVCNVCIVKMSGM